jgi:chromosome segregation ATPase
MNELLIPAISGTLDDFDSHGIARELSEDHSSELEVLQSQIERIGRKKELVKNAYLAQIDTIDEYRENKCKLAEEEQNVKKRIEEITLHRSTPKKRLEDFSRMISILNDTTLSEQEKHNIVSAIIKEIHINLKTKNFQIIYRL